MNEPVHVERSLSNVGWYLSGYITVGEGEEGVAGLVMYYAIDQTF